jgi:thiosulfate dehydrogenase [quinone] large subunit
MSMLGGMERTSLSTRTPRPTIPPGRGRTGGRHLFSPAAPAWVLWPLRVFLGLTFTDAGAGKLLAPAWFGSGPKGFAVQAQGFVHGSPIGGLLRVLVLPHPLPFAFLIAVVELAVGLLTLAGLATRPAAATGAALSLLFFLTASWRVRPFFYGPDLPFLVAWMPLLLAGHAGLPSLDRLIERRSRRELGLSGDGREVAVAADRLERACQAASRDCTASCPLVAGPDLDVRGRPGLASRRAFVRSVGAAGLAVGATAVVSGAVAAVGAALRPADRSGASPARAAGATPGTGDPTGSRAGAGAGTGSFSGQPTRRRPPGTQVGSLAQLPTGQGTSFTNPYTGRPAVLIRARGRTVNAYDAVCTHAGCTVGYDPGSGTLQCPCHGATFDPASGDVTGGPAETPLPSLRVTLAPDGGIYLRR